MHILFITAAITSLISNQPLEPRQNLKPISQVHRGEESHYIFLKDLQNKEWILKQYHDDNLEDHLDLVFEAVASKIAQSLGIAINYVKLISPLENFEAKIFFNRPASLHLKVPGEQTTENFPWKNFDLHQKFRSPWMTKKNGPLEIEERGLRKIVIENMAKHPMLCKIAALDTYLGNIDRSHPNIFYDSKTDSFYGIDMGNSFKGNLCDEALQKIKFYKKENTVFSPKELEALKFYAEYLSLLVKNYPPRELNELLESKIIKAKLNDPQVYTWTEDVSDKMIRTQNNIENSYKDAKLLIVEIEDLLLTKRS